VVSIIASKIKGIVIEIGGDTQKLNKALEDVNKKTRDVQSELRQVERLLKLDPSNTTLLAQKQKLLAEAVENSREKLDRLKTAQEQVNEQFRKGEINEEQYRAFQREVVKAEQELSKFEKQLRETGLTAEQVGKKLQDAGQKMTDVGKKTSTYVTAPIVAAGAASFKMAADLQDAMGATDQIFKGAADSVKTWADNLESYYGIAEGEALEYANMMGSMLVNIGGLTEEQAAKQAATLIELAGDLTAMYGGTTADAVRALTGALKGNNTMLDNYGMAANDAMIKTKALEMGLYDGTGQMDLATKQAATLALIMEQTGAAQGQAAREAEGSSGSMRDLATVIKNIATEIGEVLLPVITPFIQRLKDIVGTFSELSPGAQKAIIAIAGIAAAIGPLLLIFGPLISSIGTLITGLGAMSTAMAGGATLIAGLTAGFPALGAAFAIVTGPIGIAVAAIAALVAMLVHLYRTNEDVRANMQVVWNGIKAVIDAVMPAILYVIETVWNNIKGVISGALNVIQGLIAVFAGILTGDFKGMWEGIKQIFSGAVEFIFNFVQLMFIGKIMAIFKNFAKAGFELLKGNWANILNGVKQFGTNILNLFKGLWDIVTGTFKGFSSTGTNIINALRNTLTSIVQGLVSAVKSLFSGMSGSVTSIMSSLRISIQTIWNNIVSFFRGINLRDIGRNIIQGLINGITSMASEAMRAARNLADNVSSTIKNALKISSPSKVMEGYGKFISEGLAQGIDAARYKVSDSAVALVGGVTAPAARGVTAAAGGGAVGTGGGGVTITGNTFYVRNDQDIKLVARELYNLQQQNARGRGLK
jgi:phage-related minor tail protein